MGKEIYIDGTDVSGCEFYSYIESDKYPHRCTCYKDMYGANMVCDLADCCKNCYYKQLKRKEQECEELKEAIDGLLKIQHQLADSCKKYEQALIEIKEIAEQISLPMGTGKRCNRVILANQILQKINEVV